MNEPMDATAKLREIVDAAKGDDLERAEMRRRGSGIREPYHLLQALRRARAEWQAAHDLLEEMIREREAAEAGRIWTGRLDRLEDYFEGVWAKLQAPPGHEAEARSCARAVFFAGCLAFGSRLDDGNIRGEDPRSLYHQLWGEIDRVMREEWPEYSRELTDWRQRQ